MSNQRLSFFAGCKFTSRGFLVVVVLVVDRLLPLLSESLLLLHLLLGTVHMLRDVHMLRAVHLLACPVPIIARTVLALPGLPLQLPVPVLANLSVVAHGVLLVVLPASI